MKMNAEITPLYSKRTSIKLIITMTVIIGLVGLGFYKLVLADNQPPVDPITTLNAQINEIDKKLMVNSQIYNNSQTIISTEKTKQDTAQKENDTLRMKKQKLIDEKEAKLLGK